MSEVFFRALSEADDFCNAREQRDELQVRLDELMGDCESLEEERTELRARLVAEINERTGGLHPDDLCDAGPDCDGCCSLEEWQG